MLELPDQRAAQAGLARQAVLGELVEQGRSAPHAQLAPLARPDSQAWMGATAMIRSFPAPMAQLEPLDHPEPQAALAVRVRRVEPGPLAGRGEQARLAVPEEQDLLDQ